MKTKSLFTPTQCRILDLLSDGMPHSCRELIACLWDEMGSMKTVAVHICGIREVIRKAGEDIVCEVWKRKKCYRHITMLSHRTVTGKSSRWGNGVASRTKK